MEEKLIKFIKENSLSFIGEGSGLNGQCVIISGYASYIGVQKPLIIINAIKEVFREVPSKEVKDEIKRVFDFALTYNYGKWWLSDEAKAQYKF